MEVILNDQPIQVVIERKKNKNIYIRAFDSRTLKVSCNSLVRESQIQKMIIKNAEALQKMLDQKRVEEERNAYFWYLGKPYIKVFDSKNSRTRIEGQYVYAKDEKSLAKFYQAECKRIFTAECQRILPSFANLPFFELKIRAMKTRWGVNNQSAKTITLNSELLKKDLDLLDYVIIHELCHFYEPNHSARFWHHVYEYYPHYKEARRRLRQ